MNSSEKLVIKSVVLNDSRGDSPQSHIMRYAAAARLLFV